MANGGLGSGWRIARIFGITIRLHVSWVVIFLLLTFSLATHVLPLSNLADGGSWWQGLDKADQISAYLRAHPGLSEAAAARHFGVSLWPEWQFWVLGAVGAVGLFVCVLAHELSHSLLAQTVGMPVEGITLFVFGGVARIRDEARSPGAEFKVAAAGPLMSVAIALGSAVLYYGFGPLLRPQGRSLVFYFMFVNVLLVAFNLVPGFPLDGGRLLRALLWKVLGNIRQATFIASWGGRLFAGLLILIGVAQFFYGGLGFGPVWLIVIGLFLWNAAKSGYQQLVLRETFAGLTVRDAVHPDVVSVPPELTLDRLVDGYFYPFRLRSFPVLQEGTLVGTVSLKAVQAVPRAEWPLRRVDEVMQHVGEANAVRPDDDLALVFRRMIESKRDHLPVTENGRLVGIVTRKDIVALVQLKTDLGERGAAQRA